MMLPLAILSLVLSANAADVSALDESSYDDLKQLNVSCHPKDTCAGREPDYSPGLSFPNTCSCHAECSSLGTCCIDSPHRGLRPTSQNCGAVDFPRTYFKSSGYYMVRRCPEGSVWKHLCEGGLDKEGDVLRIAPVTSLDTNTTYRNYYCLRCNELTDNFLYWDLNLLAGFNGPKSATDDFRVVYNDTDDTWSAIVDEDASVPVALQFLIPLELSFPVISCNPKVVADCPDSWEDDAIRSKCDTYMATLYRSFGPVYKNAHCALCNSQPLDELSCIAPKHPYIQKSFSFAHLIDVNGSYRDGVGKKAKCAEGEKWDPYGKKCRKLSCALPGYLIKDGKCVAP